MDVQGTRFSCSRPSAVGTSLPAPSTKVRRDPSCAPGMTHCPTSTRPTRHRYPFDRREARQDRSAASSDTPLTEVRSTGPGQCIKCFRVLQTLCLLLSGPLPVAGGALTPPHQAGPRSEIPAPGATSNALQAVPSLSSARKRAYKRAVRRASQHPDQHTTYRGRVCTLQQLCRGYQGHQPRPKPQRHAQLHALQRSQTRLLECRRSLLRRSCS